MANVAYGHGGTAPVNHGGGAPGSYESSGGWSRRGRGQRQVTRPGGARAEAGARRERRRWARLLRRDAAVARARGERGLRRASVATALGRRGEDGRGPTGSSPPLKRRGRRGAGRTDEGEAGTTRSGEGGPRGDGVRRRSAQVAAGRAGRRRRDVGSERCAPASWRAAVLRESEGKGGRAWRRLAAAGGARGAIQMWIVGGNGDRGGPRWEWG